MTDQSERLSSTIVSASLSRVRHTDALSHGAGNILRERTFLFDTAAFHNLDIDNGHKYLENRCN